MRSFCSVASFGREIGSAARFVEDGSDFDAYQRIHTGKMTGLNNGMINVVPKKYIYLKTNVLVF